MENFIAYNPTKLHFGKDVTDDLGKTILKYGKKVLLVLGKNSVKKSGLYDRIKGNLLKSGIIIFEYSGIKPNPVVEDVDAAAEMGRIHNVDLVLAVGGGSVIDSAKIIAITVPVKHSCWDFYTGKMKPVSALPLIAVLTLAATGTEMNPYAVLQNNNEKLKEGYGNPMLYPAHSFLDPAFTYTVPVGHTAFGVADLIAHCLEAYFGKGNAHLSDRFVFAVVREAMEVAPLLLKNLNNYEYRERIMYAASCALNGMCLYGRTSGDWGVHSLGHTLSLLYDIAHGASLSIMYPAWLKLHKNRIPERISELGVALFGTHHPDDTIAEFEKLFGSLGCPLNLNDAGAEKCSRNEIIAVMVKNKVGGANHKLSHDDYELILDYIGI